MILFSVTSHLKRLLIDICTNTRFENMEKLEGLLKTGFKVLLSLATQFWFKSYFIFNRKLYKQVDGVAMASLLGTMLDNAFLVHFNKKWLQSWPSDFKPYHYQQYVDGIFVLLTSPKPSEAFPNVLNGRHANMSFTIESEKENRTYFFDVHIICKDKTFTTFWNFYKYML